MFGIRRRSETKVTLPNWHGFTVGDRITTTSSAGLVEYNVVTRVDNCELYTRPCRWWHRLGSWFRALHWDMLCWADEVAEKLVRKLKKLTSGETKDDDVR